ncbi:hypothetical protein FGLOB1_10671 [Fusarium globosum]|uniref:Uncharacterized protein n=1 Tax=Fusarium globosum TaxID=78864 RepID=A0A8H5XUS1_9HYPO|nr:hypothetical protein FGLOB1_10671 [Fusarium globosum]
MLIEELKSMRDGIRPLKLGVLRAAILGQSVPEEFSHELVYECLVAGIRHHAGFAVEIRGKTVHHSIERAFNARDIMSGRVPEMEKPEDVPYCFWYPDVPGQDILRQLLKDHPTVLMSYQVGRACAVGGYVDLYKELDILPDVSIAEEPRAMRVMVFAGSSLRIRRISRDFSTLTFPNTVIIANTCMMLGAAAMAIRSPTMSSPPVCRKELSL